MATHRLGSDQLIRASKAARKGHRAVEGAARWPRSRARTAPSPPCPSPPCPLSSRPPLLPIAASRLRVKPRPSSGSPVGGTAGRVAGKVQGWCHTVHRVPSALFFRAISPGSGHKDPLNRPLRGLPGVVGRFRRVVVSRRCTQHHLRRVMVETPPRAGPSPPHGPARFFHARFPALRRTLPRRPPPDAAQPPAASRQPPAASRRPPAASRQPGSPRPSGRSLRATPFVMLTTSGIGVLL